MNIFAYDRRNANCSQEGVGTRGADEVQMYR